MKRTACALAPDVGGRRRGRQSGAMMKTRQATRSEFAHFMEMGTRWSDNDAYGHVNNVVYYSFFDTTVNRHMIDAGALDTATSAVVGLVVETQCQYYSSISYPDRVTVGLRVAHIGKSSVRYELGVFRNEEIVASAQGHYVHVYVDRASQTPVSIPTQVRAVLQTIVMA